MKYIEIVDWEDCQHYRKRRPIWIKFYHQLLDNYEYQRLNDKRKLLLVHLRLLRAKIDGALPLDYKYLNQNLKLENEVSEKDIQTLIEKGFITLLSD